ncbi:branched-chain amino acid ABC transporter permease [Paracoccus suum]|uniref:Branched-chain amino acid ABC transporter permease n=1 Tax=Paracoccus suum TaxID=2259340 RepID=A0A344PPL5_9RHOB|nr:branched-chain amino acid ABC transporter permease [Paracoccus suum]
MVQSGIDALSLGSLYALTALGIGLIFSVVRLVNFAQGIYMAFCAYAIVLPTTGGLSRLFLGALPTYALVATVLLFGILLALLSEVVLFRYMRGAQPATMMVASFALGAGLQNLLMMIYGSRPVGINLWPGLARLVEVGGVNIPLLQIVTVVVTLAILAALSLFLRNTRFGAAMRASAENFRMAQMLGVPANRIILVAFAMSGALAAVTALLTLPQTGMASLTMGEGTLLVAFVATVVGGLGSLTGAVLSAYLIGVISVLFQIGLPVEVRPFRNAFVYLFVIVVLLLRPQGLFNFGQKSERI